MVMLHPNLMAHLSPHLMTHSIPHPCATPCATRCATRCATLMAHLSPHLRMVDRLSTMKNAPAGDGARSEVRPSESRISRSLELGQADPDGTV